MRKYLIMFICTAMVFAVMTGCSKSKEDKVTFTATVLEVGESYILVEPVEGSSELRSSNKIRVFIGDKTTLVGFEDNEITIDDITIEDKVEITYNGVIAESYPAQISKCYRVKVLN